MVRATTSSLYTVVNIMYLAASRCMHSPAPLHAALMIAFAGVCYSHARVAAERGRYCHAECHKAKNLVPESGGKPTKVGEKVLQLQRMLPLARVVYCSATGAPSSPCHAGTSPDRTDSRAISAALSLTTAPTVFHCPHKMRMLSFSVLLIHVHERWHAG